MTNLGGPFWISFPGIYNFKGYFRVPEDSGRQGSREIDRGVQGPQEIVRKETKEFFDNFFEVL